MKSNKIYFNIIAAAAAAMSAISCNFLDVAPAKKADLSDAMKNKSMTEQWLYGNYHCVNLFNPVVFTMYEGSTDEFVTPDAWTEHPRQSMAYGLINGTNVNDQYWRYYYGSIGNIHLFLRELERQNPAFLTDSDKALYKAHTDFLKGYYYFKILSMFGPCPIVEEYKPSDTPSEEFPGRYHFDYVVDYICGKLDAASSAPEFPAGYALDETYGRGNKTICAALKSRLLLYAASPLWNGDFPYPAWANRNFETPGYGLDLVSHTFDIEKWRRAKDAAEDAILIAQQNGRRLLRLEDAETMLAADQISLDEVYIPGLEDMFDGDAGKQEEFKKRVMLMRYLSASDETMQNKELIFTTFGDGQVTSQNARAALPRNIIINNNGTYYSGYCGISPTLETVEAFYTSRGKLPAEDPEFTQSGDWLKSAGVEGREEIINLNMDREPRFYAWIQFDGCDVGPRLVDGSPLRLDLRSSDKSGYVNNASLRDQCQTGFLSYKFVPPATQFTGNSDKIKDYPITLIRMAELYLNLAECCAELYMNGEAGELQNALDALNKVRERAGVPQLTADDCTDDMTIRDWVRAERRIELFMEGHRYYDLRRWCVADEYLAKGKRTGLNGFRNLNPSIEVFNQVKEVEGDYCWYDRMYLMPVTQNEIYNDPQLVQAPGY